MRHLTRHYSLVLLALLTVLVVLAPPAGAQLAGAWFVDGTNGADTNGGRSWDDALQTLPAAIAAESTTIHVKEGTYAGGVVLRSGLSVIGGYSAALTGTALTINDPSTYPTVIQAAGGSGMETNDDTVADTAISLYGLRFIGTDSDQFPLYFHDDVDGVTLEQLTFTASANSTVWFEDAAANVTVRNCTWSGQADSGLEFGGVSNAILVTGNSIVTPPNEGRWGGIQFYETSSNVTITNNVIDGLGGSGMGSCGIHFWDPCDTVTITGNTLQNMQSRGCYGIHFWYRADHVTLQNNTLDNLAGSCGGIQFWDPLTDTLVDNNTLTRLWDSTNGIHWWSAAADLTISNNTLSDMDDVENGIVGWDNTTRLAITDNTLERIYGVDSYIAVWDPVTTATISGNVVRNLGDNDGDPYTDPLRFGGIFLFDTAQDVTISDNEVSNLTSTYTHISGHSGLGIICYRSCNNVVIENNLVKDITGTRGDGVGFGNTSTTTYYTDDSFVRNNVILNVTTGDQGGGLIWSQTGCGTAYHNNVVQNCTRGADVRGSCLALGGNTFVGNGVGIRESGTENTFAGNIVTGSVTGISCENGASISVAMRNCLYNNTTNYGGLTAQVDLSDNITGDPLFVNAAGADSTPGTEDDDLRLSAGSPCIDAGYSDACATTDALGNARYDVPEVANTGSGTAAWYDIGAFEYAAPERLYVNHLATGANDGSSWADAFTDLQDALTYAGGGTAVWIAQGTYKPTAGTDRNATFTIPDGALLYGGFDGTESTLAARDWQNNVTILSGDIGAPTDNADNSYHVVTGSGGGAGTTLDGVTITAGNANDTVRNGGGVYAVGGSLTIRNCTFANCAAQYGGGLYLLTHDGVVADCAFRDNTASFGGGGVWAESATTAFSNNTFTGNRATNAGGAVCAMDFSGAFTGCTFTTNSADFYGGAVCGNGGTPALTDCLFNDNGAGWGGAVYTTNATAVLSNCFLFANSATQFGGGTFTYNDTLTVTNCTFTANTAEVGAGAVFVNDNATAALVMTNSVAWNNTAPTAPVYGIGAAVMTVTYSCIEGGLTGTGNIDADPLFTNAGAGDCTLQAGSPCIDAADGNAAPTTDMDGNTRHDDPATADTGTGTPTYADMGAFEYLGTATLPTVSIADVTVTEGGTATFTITISAAPTALASVDFASSDGTATAGVDYGAVSGIFNWPANDNTVRNVSLQTTDDTTIENDETFFVTLSNPTGVLLGTAVGTGTISDNDDPLLSVRDVQVSEGVEQATLTVEIRGAPLVDATVDYATSDGTATAGADYTATSGTLTFPAGETGKKTFDVPILDDISVEDTETIAITLSNAVNAVLGQGTATVRILDDDTVGTLAVYRGSRVVTTTGNDGVTRATVGSLLVCGVSANATAPIGIVEYWIDGTGKWYRRTDSPSLFLEPAQGNGGAAFLAASEAVSGPPAAFLLGFGAVRQMRLLRGGDLLPVAPQFGGDVLTLDADATPSIGEGAASWRLDARQTASANTAGDSAADVLQGFIDNLLEPRQFRDADAVE